MSKTKNGMLSNWKYTFWDRYLLQKRIENLLFPKQNFVIKKLFWIHESRANYIIPIALPKQFSSYSVSIIEKCYGYFKILGNDR